MPLGAPAPRKITRIIKNNETLFKLAITLYKPYLKNYTVFWTWWNINRFEEATIKPFELIWVKPSEIKYALTQESKNWNEGRFMPRIRDGNWDKDKENFENYSVFTSIKSRIENESPWEKTRLYKENIELIRNNKKGRYNTTTEEELKEALNKIDRLYETIKENGYKRAEKANKKTKVSPTTKGNLELDNFHDIAVSIGRDGEILFEDGRHRLAIAKVLDIDEIPVRVLVRHRKWQDKRNEISLMDEVDEEVCHPDLKKI